MTKVLSLQGMSIEKDMRVAGLMANSQTSQGCNSWASIICA